MAARNVFDLLGEPPKAEPVNVFDLLGEAPVAESWEFNKEDYYRKLNESLSPGAKIGTGFIEGLKTIGRGIGMADQDDPREKAALDELADSSLLAAGGRIAGEAAPFMATLPLAGAGLVTGGGRVLIPVAQKLLTRIGLGAATAGGEALAISRGQGRDESRQAVDVGVGASIGAAIEVLVPVLGRLGNAIFRRLGRKPTKPLLSGVGEPSQELIEAMRDNGTTFNDLTDEAIDFIAESRRTAGTQAGEVYDEMSGVTDAMRRGKKKKLASAVDPDPRVLESAERLGVENELIPSSYSRNQPYIEMEQALKSRPESRLAAQESASIKRMQDLADETIDRFDGYTDKSLLDSAVKADFTHTIDDLTAKAKTHYDLVRDTIPGSTEVQVAAARDYINKTLTELGGEEMGKKRLAKVERDLLDLADTNPTYAYLDRLRKSVGDALHRKAGVYADESTGVLKQVYKALSEDQRTAATAFGVGEELIAAQKYTATRKAIEERSVKLFGKEVSDSLLPKLSAAATSLTKGDVSKLDKLFRSLPESRRGEAAATMLNDLFTMGARSKQGLSQGFVNAYAALNRNKQAKNVLFSYLPDGARQRFDDLGTVATAIFNAKSKENTSNTARALMVGMDSGHIAEKIFGVGSKAVAAESITGMAGLPGFGTLGVLWATRTKTPASEAADKLLSSGAFRDAVLSAVEGNADKSKKILSSKPFQAWMKYLPPEDVSRITTAGLVPWLIADEEQK
jgi:hypothetical protein